MSFLTLISAFHDRSCKLKYVSTCNFCQKCLDRKKGKKNEEMEDLYKEINKLSMKILVEQWQSLRLAIQRSEVQLPMDSINFEKKEKNLEANYIQGDLHVFHSKLGGSEVNSWTGNLKVQGSIPVNCLQIFREKTLF